MNTPLISVIIPFYNMEAFLEEAVESVLQQTYTNWELLLIDDGSKDKSPSLAKKFITQFPGKIFYYTHEGLVNKGLTETRNKGVKNAKGTYIALLDADDCWLPEKLEKQVAIINAFPECALIGGASAYWYSWADASKEDVIVPVGGINDRPVSPPQFAFDLYPLGEGAAPCPCCLIFKTEIAKKHKGFEPQFSGIFQMYEDQAFLAKIYLNEKVYMSSECLDKYRQRPNSLVGTVYEKGEYHQVRKFFLDWLTGYLSAHNFTDKKLKQKLANAQMPYQYPLKYKLKKAGNKIIHRFTGKE